ncbi:MAG: hypothetical protein PHP44_11060 [Kiritimatiellae bacterium]|nr:hypothetical protein [Kiritimatiellia bacterium]
MYDSNDLNFGPGVVFIGSTAIYSEGDIVAKPVLETFNIKTSHGGELDRRAKSRTWEIDLTPAGQISAGIITALCPWQSPLPGVSLRGSSDTNVIVWGFNGERATFYGCGVFKMPSLSFAVDKPLFGACTIKVLGKNNTAVDAAEKYYKLESAAFTDSSFSLAAVLTQAYSASWGSSSPWDAIYTDENGFTVDIATSWTPRYISGEGIVDYTLKFSGTSVTAKFKPINPTAAEFLTAQQLQGTQLGVSMATSAQNLIVSASGVHFTLYKGIPHEGSLVFGEEASRNGELQITGTRVAWNDPLFRLATAAPEA